MSTPATTVHNADGDSTSDTIGLLVKNPTDRPGGDPFTLRQPLSSTVLDLKQRLSEAYPGSPPVQSQRLIYAGKLLDNRHTLEAVMASCDRSVQHTIHLVVSSPSLASSTFAASSQRSAASLAAPPYAPDSTAPAQPTPNSSAPQNLPPGTAPNQLPNVFNPFMPAFPQNIYPVNVNGQPYMYPAMPTAPGQGAPLYNMPYAAPQFPAYPPPPSDNVNENQTAYRAPFAPMDPTAYASHLQAMERIITDTLIAQQNIQDVAEGADREAQAAAAAAAASAATAAMHAQAHAQALAAAQAGENAAQHAPFPQGLPQNGIAFGVHVGRGHPANQPGVPGAAGVAQRPIGNGEPRVRQYVFHFELNWSLITKLIFLVVFLVGQEGSSLRVYTLVILAVLIYLWHMGRLGFLRRITGTVLPNPTQLFEILFPREAAPASGENAADGQGADEQPRPRVRNRFGRVAVILSFAYSFIYGFICSLLPAWRPIALPDMDELMNLNANRPPQTDRPPQTEEPLPANVDGANNDHEHAD